MTVEISVLGHFTVAVDGVAADERRLGDLGRLAFAYLVLERHRPVPRDELADVLWGEDLPATWEAALRGVVSRVRSTLASTGLDGLDALRNQFGCYQMHLAGRIEIDVERVAAGVGEAEATLAERPDRARQAAVGAAELAGRRFLPGVYGAWVERSQFDLTALRVRALELLSAAASACADHGTAATAAEQAIGLAPLRESAHQCLMAAHARAGNRGAALWAYTGCRELLAEELGVNPSGQTEALYLRLLDDQPGASTPRPPSNLPASATSFVGRVRETAELERLLRSTRLLTLVGPGGVGKSRLALHLAEHLLGRDAQGLRPGGLWPEGAWVDGVWLVELAGLDEPALVTERAGSILGVPEQAGLSTAAVLARFVADRHLLVVLDNCEHLVRACAELGDLLLRSSSALQILATSREPLGVPGETTWFVPPLAISDPGCGKHPSGLRSEAAELFRHRALAAAPGLDLDATERQVEFICAQLEGIPLAIELAAARTRALSVTEVATHLDDHLRLLVGGPRVAPGRHQTLRATIDWSYQALSEKQRSLLARLSVFAGGWRLDAAEIVCGGPGIDILDAIGALVDKSLVSIERVGGDVRYRMLETVRQYGAEHLARGEGEHDVRHRHLRWAAELAEAGERGLEGGDQQGAWLAVLDDEHDNVRRALDWAAAHHLIDDGLRLAAAMQRFWEVRGHLDQGRSRLRAVIGPGVGPPALRAKAVHSAAVLAQRQGDLHTARALYHESLAILRALDDQRGIATALHGLANLAVADGDLVTARSLFEENLGIARQLGLVRMEAASLMNLGVVAQTLFMRDVRPRKSGPEARIHYQQSQACSEAVGDRFGVALALENLGALERFLRGAEVSRQLHLRSLAIRRELGDKQGIATSARFLGGLARSTGEMATARQLHEERLVLERELGNARQIADALRDLGDTVRRQGNLNQARRHLEESRAIYVAAHDREAAAEVAGSLSDVAHQQGHLDEAVALLEESLVVTRECANHHGEAWTMVRLAQVSRTRGDKEQAVGFAREALDLANLHHLKGVEAAILDLLAGRADRGGRWERGV